MTGERTAGSNFDTVSLPLGFPAGSAALVMISRTQLCWFTSQVNNYLQVG